MDQKNSPYFRLLLLTIVISSLLKIAFFAFSGLSIFTEEAQYWLWSKHLDWNYYSKPLLIALYNALSSALLGDTWWAIKANALLFHAATLLIFYRLALRFLSPKQAFIASLLLLCSPFLHIASLFHTTDSSLYFFWTLGLYLSVKTIEQPVLKNWAALGLCLLLGILSKNIMVLLLPTWALFMTLQAPGTWKKPGPYLMLGISLLSLIPVLYWNLQNDFVTFRHVGTLGGVAGTSTGPSLLARLGEYIGGQLGFFSPFYLPLLALALKDLRYEKSPSLRFLLYSSSITWVLFLLIAIQKPVYVNWPAFAWFPIPILILRSIGRRAPKWRSYTYGALALNTLLLYTLFLLPLQKNTESPWNRLVPPAKDPFKRLAGYESLAEEVDRLLSENPGKPYFVFSDDYHTASSMAFYLRQQPQTYVINMGRRMNQFDLWPGIEQYEGQEAIGIYLTRAAAIQPAVHAGFEHVQHLSSFPIRYRGEILHHFQIGVFENLIHIQEFDTKTY